MYCSEDDWFLARVRSNWQNHRKVDTHDPRNIKGMTSLPWKIWEMQTIAGEILIVIDVLLHRPVLRFLGEYLLLQNENIFLVVLKCISYQIYFKSFELRLVWRGYSHSLTSHYMNSCSPTSLRSWGCNTSHTLSIGRPTWIRSMVCCS